jgi:hypothetical protein
MHDLFNSTEVSKEPLTTETPTQPLGCATPLKKGRSKSLFKVYYKGKGGKFSDKESARIVQIEKDNRIFKNNWYYWKRQATRLSEDYTTEHEKVLKLEAEIKQLKSMPNLFYPESYSHQNN